MLTSSRCVQAVSHLNRPCTYWQRYISMGLILAMQWRCISSQELTENISSTFILSQMMRCIMQKGDPVPQFLFSSLLVSNILTYLCVKFAVRAIKQVSNRMWLRFICNVSKSEVMCINVRSTCFRTDLRLNRDCYVIDTRCDLYSNKSLARPGRSLETYEGSARFQQHRGANCHQVFFFPLQGTEGNSRHSYRNISLFPSW